MEQNGHMQVGGKNVLVVGLGKSGIAAAEALKSLGASVSVYDEKEDETKAAWAAKNGFSASFGKRPAVVEGFDLLVLSPGVPADMPYLSEAAQSGAEIIGELELAYRCGGGTYIAITGTNGKTTTTALVGEIFKNAGKKTEVVGNIGVAVVSKALEAKADTFLVTECSSFQLETIKYFRPQISAMLNVTPDHLNRHKTMENYILAKANIFMNQGENEYFIYNADDEIVSQIALNCQAVRVPFSRKKELEFGAFIRDGHIVIAGGRQNGSAMDAAAGGSGKSEATKAGFGKAGEITDIVDICGADELQIPGLHNLENALAAAAVAYFAGIGPDVIGRTLREFSGVSHRIERCGQKNGVSFVNDSKGTNPDAAIKAVQSFSNIILIAGGYDKGSNYDEFIASFEGHVKALVLMGATARKIREAAEAAGFNAIYMVNDMKEAVEVSYRLAKPGDTVLLSPACASWGMYPNFEVRGDDFKQRVREIPEN